MRIRIKHYIWLIFLCIDISILFFEPISIYNSQAVLGPLIYTQNDSLTFYAGNPPVISWYIISNNPDIYWITLKEVKNSTYIIDEGLINNGTILTSVIKFQPFLPTGIYIITLFVEDYSFKVGNSSVLLNIFVSTSPSNFNSATPSFSVIYILLAISVLSGSVILFKKKNKYKKH